MKSARAFQCRSEISIEIFNDFRYSAIRSTESQRNDAESPDR